MNKKSSDLFEAIGQVVHMAPFRGRRSSSSAIRQDLELALVGHFREQNENLNEQNQALKESVQEMHSKLDRLTNGLDRLVSEMHGIRTGKREEAFARIGEIGSSIDLPTVRPDAALIYGLTLLQISDNNSGSGHPRLDYFSERAA